MTAANVQRTGVNIGPKAPTRRDDNGERGSGSFDDVLSRSMGADRQGSRVPEVNSPSPQPARRKDDTDTSEPATAKHPDFVPEAAASTTTAPASSSVREPGATSGSTGSLDAGKEAAAGKPRTLSAGQVSKAGASQTAMGLTPDRDALTTSAETADVVTQIAHPAIRMQFDTGALTINGEDPATVLQESAGLMGHIHASEPNLLPLGDGGADHAKMFRALMQHLPNQLVTIEMVATHKEPHLVSIERALGVAIQHYRPSASRSMA